MRRFGRLGEPFDAHGPAMVTIGYHAMRMRCCRASVAAFLRRWAVHIVAAAVLFAAGMPGGPGDAARAVRSLCAWSVLPLFWAAARPFWLVAAIGLQALFGAGLVWGMRSLLWSARWAGAERALPIARRDTVLSDCRLVPVVLLPWMLVCAVGAAALIANDPAWLHPVRVRALLALGASLAGSTLLGVGLLYWIRRAPRASRGPRASMVLPDPRPRANEHRVEAVRALLWWPLWRGPARRSGSLMAWGSLALCAPAIGLLGRPSASAWWLAAYALGALSVVTRLNGVSRGELQPLLRACAPLPLSPRMLQRRREALAMTPLGPSGALLLACLPHAPLRPWVLAAYVIAVTASCAIEVRSLPQDAAAKASRWVFCVALMLALGSEVQG